MAIVVLEKLTVYGTAGEKEAVLKGLQQLGCLHLINLRETPATQPELVSKEARGALRYLHESPIQRQAAASQAEYDRDQLIRDVLEVQERREQLREERELLQTAITELEPWGDFHLPSPDEFDVPTFWFYVIPLYRTSELPEEMSWHIAATDHQFAFVVLLADEAPTGFPFKPIALDPRPLSVLIQRREAVAEELERLYWKRVSLTRWRQRLQDDLDAADDLAARISAAQKTWEDHHVFALQGWVPQDQTQAVQRFASRNGLALTMEPAREGDAPPTLLRNPDRIAGAEGCVTFYITPQYHAWDPTTIVYFSFSLFFAMIVADAGYGLVLMGLLMLAWKQLAQSRNGVRLRHLLLGVFTATVVYGIVVGSYFGLAPPRDSILEDFQVKLNGQPLMQQQNAMMFISVAIGVVHLVLANAISAWQQRKSARCLGHIGWAVIILGGFAMGGSILTNWDPLWPLGETSLMAGAILVLLFSSELPLATRSWRTHLRRLGEGALQFANLSKAFGDALSYLRLFALGLASAQLAVTFNGLASDAARIGGIGVLLALLIFVAGHGINLLLGLMGGVVHGLRLNCIEFFNWSLTDEGYAFQPFRQKVTN